MNPFHRYAAAGFTPFILPIIPVGAELVTASRIPPEKLGKIPGKYIAGLKKWVGFAGWADHVATPEDVALWATWPGAGLGLRTGALVAIDVDITCETRAKSFGRTLFQQFGEAPARVGNPPKFLALFRLADGDEMFGKTKTSTITTDGVVHAVEILGRGQQFVAEGKHPKTGKDYSWHYAHPCELGFNQLPRISSRQCGTSCATAQPNGATASS